jgi:hypothetical protein
VGPVNATTFTGDGSQLTGIEGFPFTGSARITGSLVVVGPVNATSFTGSLQGTATSASYIQLANVDGFTAYSASVNTAIDSVLDATTPLTATVNTGSSPFTLTSQSIVVADSTDGNLTINLPDLNAIVGTPNQKPIVVYKNDYSQNVIYVQPSGSQLVNGASQDIIVSIQLAVIYNPTSAGWVTEGTSAQSLAELELFFLPLTQTGSLATTGSNAFRGNQIVTGSLTVTGGINATITGSATSASYVEYTNVANKPALVSSSAQIVGYNIFATTGSNQFNGSQAITGSLTVTGQVIAQTLNVQQVTSSIVYSSGSNIFGNSLSNTQQFTGSVSVTGSLTVVTAGTELQVTSTGVNLGNIVTDNHNVTGSLRVSGSMTLNGALTGTSAAFSGNVSLNTSNIILGLGNGANNESIVLSYNSNASSRSWRIIKDWTAFGDFQIQQSTTQTGTTYADILRFSPAGAANFSNSLRIQGSTVPASGSGTELAWDGTNGYLLAFNRTTSAYLPLFVQGSSLGFTGAATFSSTLQANGNAFILPTLSGGGAGGGLYLGVYPDTQYTKQAILVERYASTLGNYGRGSLHFCNRDTADANQPTLADSRMVITSAGNVGIGTNNPGQLLEVVGGEIKAGRVDTSNEGGQLSFGRASDNATAWYIDAFGSTSTPELRFVDVSNNAVRMTITSGGDVSIKNGVITTGVSVSIAALNTDYILTPRAYSGLIVIRDNTNGGSGVWLADPNQGFIQIANNMPGAFTLSWNGTNTVIRKTSGNTISISVGFYSNMLI